MNKSIHTQQEYVVYFTDGVCNQKSLETIILNDGKEKATWKAN